MPTVSQKIAEFSAEVTFEDLPADVVASLKRFVYDSVGCAFGGAPTPASTIRRRARPPSRVFACRFRRSVVANQEFEAAFPALQRCHVALDTTDGRSFELQVDYPVGDPRNPMTQEDLDAKFDALCGDDAPAVRRTAIRNGIAKLENLSARDFMGLLVLES